LDGGLSAHTYVYFEKSAHIRIHSDGFEYCQEYIMSVLVPADNPHAIDEQTQLDPLHGDVEAYVLNKLDTTIHPSFGALQQIAQARSGRPVPTSFSSAPTPFTISGTLDKLSEDNAKDEDSPL
jgi:hypothetical protein